MSNFKMGDKVKVIGRDSYFVSEMRKFEGKSGEVIWFARYDDTILVDFGTESYWYRPTSLCLSEGVVPERIDAFDVLHELLFSDLMQLVIKELE